jgi:hypothetical protein
MEKSLKPPYLHIDEKRGDYQVWIVDGAYIRGHIDEEFTNFGQHYRYSYIPKRLFNKLVRSQAANQKSCHGDVNHSSACIG